MNLLLQKQLLFLIQSYTSGIYTIGYLLKECPVLDIIETKITLLSMLIGTECIFWMLIIIVFKINLAIYQVKL